MITRAQAKEFIMLEDILVRIQNILMAMGILFMDLIAKLQQLGFFLNSNQVKQTTD